MKVISMHILLKWSLLFYCLLSLCLFFAIKSVLKKVYIDFAISNGTIVNYPVKFKINSYIKNALYGTTFV